MYSYKSIQIWVSQAPFVYQFINIEDKTYVKRKQLASQKFSNNIVANFMTK